MNDDEAQVTNALQTVFNYKNFKNDVQKKATIAINKGSKCVCVSLPPGFGRSLCYELPAVLQTGKTAVVISPKLCFIKSRVDYLRDKQIDARILSMSTRLNERKVILRDLMSNHLTVQLLYATPEIAMTAYFQMLVLSLKMRKLLSYIVFDEAHCLSEWGYEYIPCYKNINALDKVYGCIPRVVVTTTVTYKVIEDICRSLTLTSPRIFKAPVQQMNVYYDVWFLDILSCPLEHLKDFIMKTLGVFRQSVCKPYNGFAIVYCKEVGVVELLSSYLIDAGISTLACHHKLKNGNRHNVESQWISGEANVIVTTYDYGFIHRKRIICKVYWTVPENIPKYYRESVQSLVDNHRMYCRIYFSLEVYSSIESLIQNHRVMNGLEHIKKRMSEYRKLVTYCLSIKCRHAVISEYFGHVIDPCKEKCDVCEDRNIVKVRVLKFIAYSKYVGNVIYDICDIREDTKEEPSQSVKEKSSERAEEGAKKCSAVHGEISVDKNNGSEIVQYRDKQKSSSACTRSSTKGGYIQPSSASTVKRAKDNSNAAGASNLAIMRSLLDKYNLNNEISLEPCGLKNNAANTSIRMNGTQVTSGRRNVSHTGSRIKGGNSTARARTVEKEDRVTSNDSCEVIFVGLQKPKKPKRLHANKDTCPAEISSKIRKLETENKPTAVTRNRRGSRISDRDERVKDDANEIMSRGYATAEYLMNKYKLNRCSVMLKPCRK